jgi:two-component system cell cycle sensor histidine kinase PleC
LSLRHAIRTSGHLAWIGGLLVVLTLAGAAFSIWKLREEATQEAGGYLRSMGLVLAEQTSRSFQAVDLVLTEIQSMVTADGIETPAEFRARFVGPDVHGLLRQRRQALTQADAIAILDADGRLLNYSRQWPVPDLDFSDREAYQLLRDATAPGPFVSAAVVNRSTGTPTIYVARRISASDGTLLGVVQVALNVDQFGEFYRVISLREGTAIVLLRNDGAVLTRVPARATDDRSAIGGTPNFTALLHRAENPQAEPIRITSTFDGKVRLVSANSVRGYPTLIATSITEHAALAGWRRQAIGIAIAAAAAALAFAALFVTLVRQVRRLEESETALAHNNAELLGTRERLEAQAAALIDLADRLKTSQAQLSNKSEVLEATLENMDQGILMIGPDRSVQVCNRRATELLGLPADMMSSHPSFDDVIRWQWESGEFVGAGSEFQDFVKAGGIPNIFATYDRIRPNGMVLEVRTVPLAGGGAVRTFSDITARKQAEEEAVQAQQAAEMADRSKSVFLANMSHELRTPLNAVIGFSEIIRDARFGPIGAKYREYAGHIYASGRHLLTLISDVLDLSKIEARRVELHETTISIDDLLKECERFIAERAQEQGLRLSRVVAPDVPSLFVDPLRLKQVIINLLSNAVKFTPRGGSVSISVRIAADGGVEIVIADTGIGMRPEEIPAALEPFRQLDNAFTRRHEGTGLGLALASQLTTLHGGTLRIESVPAAGTTVTLWLPAQRTVRAAQARA